VNARDIEIFRSVMLAGTASKTATLLGISQSAVSQSLRKLEQSAGLRLFERVRGRLVPTPEARILLADVERHFVGLEVIEHRIRSLRSNESNRLALAAYPALGLNFLPRVVAAFITQFPGTRISLQVMSSREVHQQVLSGQVDLGLMADEMPVAGLEHSPFLRIPGVLVARGDHPLAAAAVVGPGDLHGAAFISLNAEDASRKRLEVLLENAGVRLEPVVETPYSQTVCELAFLGVGVGVANPVTALDFVERGLVLRRLAVDVTFEGILLFRTDKMLSDSARKFLSFMRIQLSETEERLRRVIGV
jgi:DNA-binding transcriptional LysR family regulator